MHRSTILAGAAAALFCIGAAPPAADTNPAMNAPDMVAWQLFLEVNADAKTGANNDALFETWASDGDTFQPSPAWPSGAAQMQIGSRALSLVLQQPMRSIPVELAAWPLALEDDGQRLAYSFDSNAEGTGIPELLRRLGESKIDFKDLETTRSSLEDIFVSLVEGTQ